MEVVLQYFFFPDLVTYFGSSLNRSFQKAWMAACEYFVGVPDLAAFKHARVHDIGAHEGHLHSVKLVGQQLVGQRLVEAHCGKLTGTIILSQTKIKSVYSVCTSIRYLQYDSSNLLRLLFFCGICLWICVFISRTCVWETIKLSKVSVAVIFFLPPWFTSTQAVLKRPRTLAMVTICPWFWAFIWGRKAFTVWETSTRTQEVIMRQQNRTVHTTCSDLNVAQWEESLCCTSSFTLRGLMWGSCGP